MHPFQYLEHALDRITMYRVVLYALLLIIGAAFLLAGLAVITPSITDLTYSLLCIVSAAYVTHVLMVRITGAPANIESTAITAFILFLILTPSATPRDLGILAGIAALAVLLKYIVVYKKRHIFNPAALALVIAGLGGGALNYFGAEWWVGSRYLLPVVLVASILVVAKVRRGEIFTLYVLLSASIVVLWSLGTETPLAALERHILSWPTIFFAGIMLTEPLGLPSTKRLQYGFVGIVALFSSIPFHVGPLYGTPELALIVGNLFTLLVDRPARLLLSFRGRTEVGKDAYEYHFDAREGVRFIPGQYLEWTLPHQSPDVRGIRRYFTIASVPHTSTVSFAVRHVPNQSSFKRALATLTPGAVLYATQRAGDFILRHNTHHVWIAGGIGITPFMSMLRDAKASGATLSATLFNCNKTGQDILFRDELAQSAAHGLSVVQVLGEPATTMSEAEIGFLTAEIIQKYVPEWSRATYYISGPPGLVNAYEKLLRDMGISRSHIVTDYFPGLA